MPESDSDFDDVAIHFKPTGVLVVVPFEVDPCKLLPFPICSYCVILLEGIEEVLSMLAAGVLDPEVVHNEDKDNWSPLVLP